MTVGDNLHAIGMYGLDIMLHLACTNDIMDVGVQSSFFGKTETPRDGKSSVPVVFVHLAPACNVMREKSEFEISLLPTEFNVLK